MVMQIVGINIQHLYVIYLHVFLLLLLQYSSLVVTLLLPLSTMYWKTLTSYIQDCYTSELMHLRGKERLMD